MFKYSFNSNYTLLNSSKFSFKKLTALELFNSVIFPLEHKYVGHKWHDIKHRPHCHQIPNHIAQRACGSIVSRADGQPIYQLPLIGRARIVGFIKNETFHIIAFDEKHQIFPSS